MTTIRKLALLIALGTYWADAGTPVRPVFVPYTEGLDKPMEQEGRRLRSSVDTTHVETGRRLKFEYDGLLADGVTTMNIDDMQEILHVSCDDGALELDIDTAVNAQALMKKIKSVSSKLIITGRPEWGCLIMHHVTAVESGKVSFQLRLQASRMRLEELFEHLTLSMVAPLPRQKTDTRHDASALSEAASAFEVPSEDLEPEDEVSDSEGTTSPPRKLWGSRRRRRRRRWFHTPAVVHHVSHAVQDAAKSAAHDVKKVTTSTVHAAKDVANAVAGKMNTDKHIPIPGVNSIRWNADAADRVINPSISFGTQSSDPKCKDCYFYVNGEVHLRVLIHGYHLQIMECTLNGKTEGQVSIQGTITGDSFSAMKDVGTITLPDIHFMVGVAPFHIKISMPVTIGADATFIGTQGTDTYDFKGWAGGTISRGLRIDSAGMSHINTVSYSYGYNIQGVPSHGAVVASAYLMPEIWIQATLIGGPVRLAEKVMVSATVYGAGSSSGQTCPAGKDYLTSSLEISTILTPSVHISLAGVKVYQKSWPARLINQEHWPLVSGCVTMSSSHSSSRRLSTVGNHGTNSALVASSSLPGGKSPIGTGTIFHAVISPGAATSACTPAEYPTIRMSCMLHTEINPHHSNAQASLLSSSTRLEFGCTQHREWTKDTTTAVTNTTTGVETNVSATVKLAEFYQMKYVLLNGKLKPLVSSQYCDANPLSTVPSSVVYNGTTYYTIDAENRSKPCYVYLSVTNKASLPKNIGDLVFNAALQYDGLTLSSDGSTTACFNLPVTMIRHTGPSTTTTTTTTTTATTKQSVSGVPSTSKVLILIASICWALFA